MIGPVRLTLARPCADCPFRRKGGIPLCRERLVEIDKAVAPADGQGGSFACHQTTGVKGNAPKTQSHCAGALVYAENLGRSTQYVRTITRLMNISGESPPEIEGRGDIVSTRAGLMKLAFR
jgi:hypothetical protein